MSQYEWPAFNAAGGIIQQQSESEEIQPPTAQELEAMVEEARLHGYEDGLAEGRAAAQAELAQQLDSMVTEFTEAMGTAQVQLAERIDSENAALVRAVKWMCKETCQSALLHTLDEPETLQRLADAMLTQLPPGQTHQVFLHPDQAHRVAGAKADADLGTWEVRIETDDLTLQYDPVEALNEQE